MRAIKTTHAVSGLLTLLGLAIALAVPASAVAAKHHRSGVHAASKNGKKGKKKSSPPLVHCASVAVKCHTHPAGPQGPTGAPGAPGAPGVPGALGKAIRLRITSAGVFATGTTPASVPLSRASWTQPIGEGELLLGQITVKMPAGICHGGETGHLNGQVLVDGQVVGIIGAGSDVSKYQPGFSLTLGVVWTGPESSSTSFQQLASYDWFIGPPGAASGHVLSLAVQDDCTDPGASHFVVSSVAVDVIRAS